MPLKLPEESHATTLPALSYKQYKELLMLSPEVPTVKVLQLDPEIVYPVKRGKGLMTEKHLLINAPVQASSTSMQ